MEILLKVHDIIRFANGSVKRVSHWFHFQIRLSLSLSPPLYFCVCVTSYSNVLQYVRFLFDLTYTFITVFRSLEPFVCASYVRCVNVCMCLIFFSFSLILFLLLVPVRAMIWNDVIQKAGVCTIHVSKRQLTISAIVCQVVAVTISVAMETAIRCVCRFYSVVHWYQFLVSIWCKKPFYTLLRFSLAFSFSLTLSLSRFFTVPLQRYLFNKIELSVCLKENMCGNLVGVEFEVNTFCGCSTAKLLSSLCHCVYVS